MRGDHKDLTGRARNLRRNMTDAEKLLWSKLRNRQFNNLKFRRQTQVGPFIADFYCHELKLVIELDGGQHSEEADRKRTEWLTRESYRVIRFWNNDVLANLDGVLNSLVQQIGPSSNSD